MSRALLSGKNVLDAVLVANEVINEVRKKNDGGLFFKIDFEKAYDHGKWSFLDSVMENKGFCVRWRNWISKFFCYNKWAGLEENLVQLGG